MTPGIAQTGAVLTEAQVVALERKQDDDLACCEIDTAHPGYLGSQDTFYVGTIKGVGCIYQQTFVDTYSKWAAAKLYTTKTPITAADLLNDRVLPAFAEQGMVILRMLTDRGTEFCGRPEHHDYELYLAINDIEHTKTKARHPQTNGICERFHKTILQEFYQVAFRRKIYASIEELQTDLDAWIHYSSSDFKATFRKRSQTGFPIATSRFQACAADTALPTAGRLRIAHVTALCPRASGSNPSRISPSLAVPNRNSPRRRRSRSSHLSRFV